MIASHPDVAVANRTISDYLLAGGGYAVYAGGAQNNSSNIVIQDNRFGQGYFPASGQRGADASFQASGTGNSWIGNVWDSTASAVSP